MEFVLRPPTRLPWRWTSPTCPWRPTRARATPLGEKRLPCHSSVLAGASNVLAEMLEGTEKDSWGAGVAATLADVPAEDAAVFMAAC